MSADDASITIKSGDTLSQRTVQYNREHGTNYTWQEVAEYNNLANPHLIHPGDVITFPSAPVQPEQPAPTVSAPSVPQPQAPKPSVPTPVYSAPAVSPPLLPSPSVDKFKQNATNELVITNATTPILSNTSKPKEWTRADTASLLGNISYCLSLVNAGLFFVAPELCITVNMLCFFLDVTSAYLSVLDDDYKSFGFSLASVGIDAFGLGCGIKPIAKKIPSIIKVGYNTGAYRYIQGNGRFIKTNIGRSIYATENILLPGGLFISGQNYNINEDEK